MSPASPEQPDADAVEPVRSAGPDLGAALQPVDRTAPTTEQVDAAKTAASEFAVASQDAFGEQECGPTTP